HAGRRVVASPHDLSEGQSQVGAPPWRGQTTGEEWSGRHTRGRSSQEYPAGTHRRGIGITLNMFERSGEAASHTPSYRRFSPLLYRTRSRQFTTLDKKAFQGCTGECVTRYSLHRNRNERHSVSNRRIKGYSAIPPATAPGDQAGQTPKEVATKRPRTVGTPRMVDLRTRGAQLGSWIFERDRVAEMTSFKRSLIG